MANQIGKFFRSQGEAASVAGIAEHIRKFWDPRMRAAILAHLVSGATGSIRPCARRSISSPRMRGRAPHSAFSCARLGFRFR